MILRLLSYNIRYGGTGREGPLAAIGIVASPEDVMARSASAANDLPVLTAADFE